MNKISDNYAVCEEVEGNYHYHLCYFSSARVDALCGKWTMYSPLQLNDWEKVTDKKEKYCKKCYNIATSIQKENENESKC